MIKKEWKAITINYTDLESFDDTLLRGVCLTQRQIAILKALLIPAYWSTRWDELTVSKDVLEGQIAAIDAALDLGCSVVFDCDEVEDCVEGSTQFTINNTVIVALFLQSNQVEIDIRINLYDGTPGSINPAAPTGTWDATPDRDVALCMAAGSFVAAWAQVKISTLETTLLGLYAALVLSTVLSGGLLLGMAVGGISLGIYAVQVAILALKDEAALQAVACCMYDDLKGKVVSAAIFETSLDSCGFTGGSNEIIVRDLIADTLDDLSNYLAMLDAAGDAFVQVEAGFENCLCDEWTEVFDFTVNDGGFVLRTDAVGDPGEYLPGVGWHSTPNASFGDNDVCWIERYFDSSVLTQVEFNYTYLAGASGFKQAIIQIPFDGATRATGAITNGNHDVTWNGQMIGENFRFNGWGGEDGGDILVLECTVKGKGVNPFL